MGNELEEHIASLFDDPEPDEVPEPEPESGESVVVPDTAGASSTVDSEEPAPEPVQEEAEEPPPSVDWEKVARGRLMEINALRAKQSSLKESHDAMEKRLRALEVARTPDDQIPAEMLEADPALRHVTKKLSSIEEELQKRRQSEEESIRFQRETQEVVRYAQESRREFLKHTPEWEEAYGFIREEFAKAGGMQSDPKREEWLNLNEHQAVMAWKESGEDPALKIYEMAIAAGWKPGKRPAQPAQRVVDPSRTRRVREAVAAPSLTSVGSRDMGQDVISREEFYTRYPHSERIRIFNNPVNGEEIFETLMKDGKVPASMLNGSPR